MELSAVVERNRRPLLRIVALMFGILGLAEDSPVTRLSLPLYRKVLRVLCPAESAVRRLIVVVARSVTLKPASPRSAERPTAAGKRKGGPRAASFRLFDPRRRFVSAFDGERPRGPMANMRVLPRPEPRVRLIDFDPRVPLFQASPVLEQERPPQPVEDGTVNAMGLSRRLFAIKSALQDLPRQARRYARWLAKPPLERRPPLSGALRPGRPPGHRKVPSLEVDELLAECDWLARQSLKPDTS